LQVLVVSTGKISVHRERSLLLIYFRGAAKAGFLSQLMKSRCGIAKTFAYGSKLCSWVFVKKEGKKLVITGN